MPEKSEL